MNTYEVIKTRRCTRKFKAEAVPDDKLEKILDAGRAAPCGGNSQTTHFLVIRSPKVLKELAELVCRTFSAMEVKPGMYKSMQAVIKAAQKRKFRLSLQCPRSYRDGQQNRLRQRHGGLRLCHRKHDAYVQRA